MNTKNNWHDLRLRLVSASFLLFISAFCIYFGSYFFTLFIISLIGVIHWELGKMLSPMSAQTMWFSAFLSMFSSVCLLASNSAFLWPILFLLINFYFQRHFFHHSRNFGAFYSLAVIVCGIIFYRVRLEFGLYHTIWLIGIVVVTDTAGYLIGRIIGGPKLIPRFSPKKTWSGAVIGWAFAVGLSLWFADLVLQGLSSASIIGLTIILSMMSQVGDICESALKRACNVKDSSHLLPGHGGFMDRFDGTVGATLAFGALSPFLVGV